MRVLLLLLLLPLATNAEEYRSGMLSVQTYGTLQSIGRATCSSPPIVEHCLELQVMNDTFSVLEIGPGGRICGPAIVRGSREGPVALELSAGVCIPELPR